MTESLDFSTRAIHAGDEFNLAPGVVPPIHQSSTFKLASAREGAEFGHTINPDRFYTRLGNPTTRQLEAVLASLECGEAALAFASGMGAISAAIFATLGAGDHAVLGQALYATTTEVARTLFPRYGIEASFVDATDSEAVRGALRANTRLILVETPTNPDLRLVDLDAIARIGRERGITTMVDSTFASPYNQNPIRHGFDLVLHSMTKYLGGHSDLTAGAVIGKKPLVEGCWKYLKLFGACLSPFEAWLLLRGIKTLSVRVERQNSTALELARFLANHRGVERVHYPGLADHPGHALAKRQMRGFGGMVAFELKGGVPAGIRMAESVRLVTLAVSLGGTESLITHPASMIQGNLPEEALRAAGVSPGLMRLSVGLEAPRDLIADLEQAIAQAIG